MLHDQFGKQALILMLVSATFWRALDRTPWISYVPDAYFKAAWEILQDPFLAELPEPWEPLPIKPASGSPDSGLEWLRSSDDEEDDDKFDKTYHTKSMQSSSSSSARSQSGASGKRPRGSGSSGKGSATKAAKT
ncbi:hypothetical protein PF003_g30260 [Phytophthora fragariae]|nr:hypothetical protein PF003_g30260 [Phytophthora fragariae]